MSDGSPTDETATAPVVIPEALLSLCLPGHAAPQADGLIRRLRSTVIPHFRFRALISELVATHRQFVPGGIAEANCLVAYGRTGSGKSHTLKYYAAKFPRVRGPRSIIHPVLYVRLPPDCSKSAVPRRILAELGKEVKDDSRPDRLETLLIKLLPVHGVQLLIIDEVQHLVDKKTDRFHAIAGDVLKNLMSANVCQFVLSGMDSSRVPMEANSQADRRTNAYFEMGAYSWTDLEDRGHFLDFLAEFADQANFGIRAPLEDEDIARRIHLATDGLVGLAARLVMKSAQVAMRRGCTTIAIEDLATAFDALKRLGVTTNPFVGLCPNSLGTPIDYSADDRTTMRVLKERTRHASFAKR